MFFLDIIFLSFIFGYISFRRLAIRRVSRSMIMYIYHPVPLRKKQRIKHTYSFLHNYQRFSQFARLLSPSTALTFDLSSLITHLLGWVSLFFRTHLSHLLGSDFTGHNFLTRKQTGTHRQCAAVAGMSRYAVIWSSRSNCMWHGMCMNFEFHFFWFSIDI